jgi:isopentenyldiphosphate isomerase
MIIPQELIFAVDELDNPISPVARDEAHKKGIWHRISHVWIINSNKELLCQKRSQNKDTNPGKWEAFFGGHVGAGESYVHAAIKETQEETGLLFTPEQLHYVTTAKSEHMPHFQAAFYAVIADNASINFEKEEVEKVQWIPIAEITNMLFDTNDPDWVHVAYEANILALLTNL